MTKEEFIEINKKRLLVKYLRTGKKSKRHGLFFRLLDLAYSPEYANSSIFRNDTSNTHNRYMAIYHPSKIVRDVIESDEFKFILNKHLGNHIVDTTHPFHVYILFNKECVDWSELDYDLYVKYPGKCYERDGAYYKK